ncbi:membrane protein [Anopheles sinensis]|uniref:Membrane protein n=1 Tax=Anopheles sinensis TaxID=74873 RepID=A0A084WDN4_ANOSI|nr:membrane protein [Anopheles sinensis]
MTDLLASELLNKWSVTAHLAHVAMPASESTSEKTANAHVVAHGSPPPSSPWRPTQFSVATGLSVVDYNDARAEELRMDRAGLSVDVAGGERGV